MLHRILEWKRKTVLYDNSGIVALPHLVALPHQ